MSEGTVRACPTCDSTEVRRVSSKPDSGTSFSERYSCDVCGDRFDEPVTRERKSSYGLTGPARRLASADKDDWPPSGGES